jgi:long-chain acyl-CoA synthetase
MRFRPDSGKIRLDLNLRLQWARSYGPEREQGSAPTPASVVEHVRNLVAGYKKPKYVFIVDALPRNSLGKVLKRELRDQATDLVENAQRLEASG